MEEHTGTLGEEKKLHLRKIGGRRASICMVRKLLKTANFAFDYISF
jgi:hypothetical protein